MNAHFKLTIRTREVLSSS